MSISSMERILDVAIKDYFTAECRVLHYGAPHKEIELEVDSSQYQEYKDAGKVLRWYFGLMGETSPEISPLSVDIANDKDYRVYRYDWVFGVSLPPHGELWWNWQKDLRKGAPVVVQLIILPGDSGTGYTCVATNLNVLPPSKDTVTWWEKNEKRVIDFVKATANTAEAFHQGWITKSFSALSNSLEARGKWKTTNWFVYQFLDAASQGCAVEWRIARKVLEQYGPLLRGSLVLAFHGGAHDEAKEPKGIRLILRPQLGFSPRDELSRVTPTYKLKNGEQVQLEILPRATRGTKQDGSPLT